MSRRSVLLTTCSMAALALSAAAPAHAVTTSPLGSCTTDTSKPPVVEGVRAPATTSVNRNGTARGTLSVSIRTKTTAERGPIAIGVTAVDLFSGKVQQYQWKTDDTACKRYNFSLANDTGFKFDRFHFYWISAKASYEFDSFIPESLALPPSAFVWTY